MFIQTFIDWWAHWGFKGPFIQSANATANANADFRPEIVYLFVEKPFK